MAVFRSPLFRKLLISAFVLIAGPLFVLDSFLTTFVAEQKTQSVQHRLTAEARILRGEVPEVDPARLENWAKEASARSQTRITIVNPQGAVVADSDSDPETMENHTDRLEILQARRGRVRTRWRRSRTSIKTCAKISSIPEPYGGNICSYWTGGPACNGRWAILRHSKVL